MGSSSSKKKELPQKRDQEGRVERISPRKSDCGIYQRLEAVPGNTVHGDLNVKEDYNHVASSFLEYNPDDSFKDFSSFSGEGGISTNLLCENDQRGQKVEIALTEIDHGLNQKPDSDGEHGDSILLHCDSKDSSAAFTGGIGVAADQVSNSEAFPEESLPCFCSLCQYERFHNIYERTSDFTDSEPSEDPQVDPEVPEVADNLGVPIACHSTSSQYVADSDLLGVSELAEVSSTIMKPTPSLCSDEEIPRPVFSQSRGLRKKRRIGYIKRVAPKNTLEIAFQEGDPSMCKRKRVHLYGVHVQPKRNLNFYRIFRKGDQMMVTENKADFDDSGCTNKSYSETVRLIHNFCKRRKIPRKMQDMLIDYAKSWFWNAGPEARADVTASLVSLAPVNNNLPLNNNKTNSRGTTNVALNERTLSSKGTFKEVSSTTNLPSVKEQLDQKATPVIAPVAGARYGMRPSTIAQRATWKNCTVVSFPTDGVDVTLKTETSLVQIFVKKVQLFGVTIPKGITLQNLFKKGDHFYLFSPGGDPFINFDDREKLPDGLENVTKVSALITKFCMERKVSRKFECLLLEAAKETCVQTSVVQPTPTVLSNPVLRDPVVGGNAKNSGKSELAATETTIAYKQVKGNANTVFSPDFANYLKSRLAVSAVEVCDGVQEKLFVDSVLSEIQLGATGLVEQGFEKALLKFGLATEDVAKNFAKCFARECVSLDSGL